jgi:hypothetical protein
MTSEVKFFPPRARSMCAWRQASKVEGTYMMVGPHVIHSRADSRSKPDNDVRVGQKMFEKRLNRPEKLVERRGEKYNAGKATALRTELRPFGAHRTRHKQSNPHEVQLMAVYYYDSLACRSRFLRQRQQRAARSGVWDTIMTGYPLPPLPIRSSYSISISSS